MSLSAEIDANYARFFEAWSAEATGNVAYSRGKEALLESHRRLAAFRALRVHVVETTLSDRAAAFFLEANNDLVTSHVCAHMCAWRAALKFLRSAVENTLSAFYFDVHPIELRLWEAGSFKLGFTTAMKFFGSHPDLAPLPDAVPGLAQIEKEYATLSKAVHASSRTFRMTEGETNILLWKREAARLGAWSTREKSTVEGLTLLCVSLLKDELKGVKNTGTRDVLQFVTSKASRKRIKETLGVTI